MPPYDSRERKDPLRWLEWVNTVTGEHREAARYAVLSGWYHAKADELLGGPRRMTVDTSPRSSSGRQAIESGNIPDALRGLALIADESTKKTQIEGVFAGFASRDINQACAPRTPWIRSAGRRLCWARLRFLAGESPDIALAVADALFGRDHQLLQSLAGDIQTVGSPKKGFDSGAVLFVAATGFGTF